MKKSSGKLSKGLARLVCKKQGKHFNKSKEVTFSDIERLSYFRMFNSLQSSALAC